MAGDKDKRRPGDSKRPAGTRGKKPSRAGSLQSSTPPVLGMPAGDDSWGPADPDRTPSRGVSSADATPALGIASADTTTRLAAIPEDAPTGRPKATQPVIRRASGKIAPPPKMPTLVGPEPELSFDLAAMSVSVANGDESNRDVMSAEPLSDGPRGETGVGDTGTDMSWELSLGADPEPSRAHPAPSPLSLPPDSGDALSLVDRASLQPPSLATADHRRELLDRFALGDFSGALAITEQLLAGAPDDPELRSIAEECRSKLRQMYISRLGALDAVPVMTMPRAELKWLSLDHRSGFLLSLVDGQSSIDEIIDVSGMTALDVLKVLFDLQTQKVVGVRVASR